MWLLLLRRSDSLWEGVRLPWSPLVFFFLRPVIANAFSPVALTQEIKAPAHVIPRRYAALPLASKDTKPRAI